MRQKGKNMNWKKAKTVLIYIFLAVNIFLFLYIKDYNKNEKLDDIRFKTVLENNNITYNLKNNNFPYNIIQTELINSSDKEFIEKFLGKKYKKNEENVFSSEKGILTFGEYLTLEVSEKKKISGLNKKNAADKAKSFIEDKKIYGKNVSYIPVEINEKDGNFIVKFSVKIKGLSLFNTYLEVELSEKGISFIKGDFIKEKSTDEGLTDIMSEKEIILELIYRDEIKNIKEAEITDIEPGFIKSEPGEIIPVYKITINSENTFFIDARYNIKKSERILLI